jgi:hypothetical protein
MPIRTLSKIVHKFPLTWVSSVEDDGRIGDCEPVVLDVHLVGGGEFWVIKDLVDAA